VRGLRLLKCMRQPRKSHHSISIHSSDAVLATECAACLAPKHTNTHPAHRQKLASALDQEAVLTQRLGTASNTVQQLREAQFQASEAQNVLNQQLEASRAETQAAQVALGAC